MNHLTEGQVVEIFYGEGGSGEREHIESCRECRDRLAELTEQLAVLRRYETPERGEVYAQQVWRRLEPKLGAGRRSAGWFSWAKTAILAPALAALLTVAFLAGIRTERSREKAEAGKVRERLLLMAISDHLERSQIVLTELLHSGPGAHAVSGERKRARNLLEENRLLRQTAAHLGDKGHAALLDDLERVLLDVANSPASFDSEDLKALQHRVEDDGLLWKIRITSANARGQGQKL